MTQEGSFLTVVVPVFNEEECIDTLFARLLGLRDALQSEGEVDFLFVDDGSTDLSLAKLELLASRHSFVKLVSLSRNFGHQFAVTAGIDHAGDSWVAIVDGDLQDPPEAIADMYRLALQGYDVVFGQRTARRGESAFKKLSAALFYRGFNRLCDIEIPTDTGDFRLMSKRVVSTLRGMRERHRFIRGMVPWLGFKTLAFPYERSERHSGVSKFPLRKMLQFAANAVLSFTARPLILAIQLGALGVLLGMVGAAYMLYLKLFTNIPVPGITSILVTIVFFSGIQIFLFGVLGAYVARIFEEIKGRPLYVIAKTHNL